MAFNYAGMPSLSLTTTGTMGVATIEAFDDAYGLSVVAPATLTSTSVYVQVSHSTASGATFGRLQSGGSDVVITAGKAMIITPIPFKIAKLEGSATEAAGRTFTVAKVFPT